MISLHEGIPGFRHLDELLAAAQSAADSLDDLLDPFEEAPQILANLAPASNLSSDEFFQAVTACAPYDQLLLKKAVDGGKLTPRQLFDLIYDAPGLVVQEGEVAGSARDTITAKQDIQVATIVQNKSGGVEWQTKVLLAAGQSVVGLGSKRPKGALLQVDEGHVALEPGTFDVKFAPKAFVVEREERQRAWAEALRRPGR